MEEPKKRTKLSVVIYILAVIAVVGSTGYLFFGNQSRISFTVESSNELIKKQSVLIEDLERGRVVQKDSFQYVQKKHEAFIKSKDSVSTKEKAAFKLKEKGYTHKIDSLTKIINSIQQSDLEPVGKKKD